MNIDVAAHISTLLYDYDQVIIPGLGAFSTVTKSAEINKFQQISPATKEVTFDKSKTANDSLLAQFIANEHHISTSKAETIISKYVQEVKSNLTNQAVPISNVGRLFLDKNKGITFAPSNTNFFNDTFGLTKIDFSPINRPTTKAAVQPIETPLPAKPKGIKVLLTNIWNDASIRTILVILVFVFIIFQINRFVNDESEIVDPFIIDTQENILDPETTHNPYQNTQEEIPTIITETENIPEQIEAPVEQQTEEEIKEAIEAEKRINLKPEVNSVDVERGIASEPETSTPKDKKTYIIIIGNFQTQANADLAASQVKKAGYVAYMKKVSDKKHRVGVTLSSTKGNLDSQLEKVKKIFPDAWVMNR